MRRTAIARVALLASALLALSPGLSVADFTPLSSPSDFSPGKTTINFDQFPNDTVANDLYLDQGVRFTRDDNVPTPIPIENWAALGIGRSTSSPPNVIATISGIAPTYVDHLNLEFTRPT